jgi:hypothetical protein
MLEILIGWFVVSLILGPVIGRCMTINRLEE